MATKKEMIRDWSQLSIDILQEFCKRLTVPDTIIFGSVCKNWFYARNNSNISAPDDPWLILNQDSSSQFALLCTTRDKYYKMYKPFKPLRDSIIITSFRSWLIIRSEPKVFILNIFSKIRIDLPSQTTMPKLSNEGSESDMTPLAFAMLTCPKLNPITVACVTRSGDLAWCNIGDQEWKALQTDQEYGNLTFFNKKLYAINRDGTTIHVFQVDDANAMLRQLDTLSSPGPDVVSLPMDMYLVECKGSLLVVERFGGRTLGFRVLKLEGNEMVSDKHCLDGYVLFVSGGLNVECIPIEECPGYRTDASIFFIGYSENGVNFELGVILMKQLDCYGMRQPLTTLSGTHSPLWISTRFGSPCNCTSHLHFAPSRPNRRKRRITNI